MITLSLVNPAVELGPAEHGQSRTGEPPAGAMLRGRDRAIQLARRHFIAGRRIEMTALAEELGVSRMTLNRWVGSRDQLVGDVNWTLAHKALRDARAHATGSGVDVVAGTLEGFIATVLDSPFQRAFLRQEGEIALRIVTTRSSSLQQNWISYVSDLLREELSDTPAGMDVDDLAYLIVRIAESFCYVDMITGGEPDATKVGVAIRALLS